MIYNFDHTLKIFMGKKTAGLICPCHFQRS